MSVDELSQQRAPAGILQWTSYVMGVLYRDAKAKLEAEMEAAGLSIKANFVLVCLDEYDGLSQQQVAERISMDRSDLVKLLDRMEASSLITRQRDSADRRRHVLSLTPAGRRALKRATTVAARVQRETYARLTDDEQRTLHALIVKALGDDS